MSLDVNRLEKVRELGRGEVQARCPACAEAGADHKGEHLRIYPDGRFGCCVHPKDKGHRSRIFALAGDHSPRRFTVRVAKSVHGNPQISVKELLQGSLGTGLLMSRAYARGEDNIHKELKDIETGVPSVPVEEASQQLETAVPSVPEKEGMPFLLSDGTLVIPFDTSERFHWWNRR
jgi:hypothetical protein